MEGALSQQLADVWARLDLVMDPELDEPVTDMGFIEAVSVTDCSTGQNSSTVDITFRLPTYWCSPNFAFLMAQDIKRGVETLPWVGQAIIHLQDHMSAEEMNAVINTGGAFSDVFADLMPNENLDALREKFDRKAFQRRQEVVIKALLAAGHSVATVLSFSLGDLRGIVFEDAETARQARRYLDLLQAKALATGSGDPAILTYDGITITEPEFRPHMDLLRAVRINMEFSGSLCRGLKRSRYKEADLSGDEPTLIDFINRGDPAHVCA